MELNRAQLLVHDNIAMEKFRATHSIPANVTIEHPEPNDVPRVVVNNSALILVQLWLIYQAELQFPINPLLKKVMAHCCLTFM